MTISDAKKKANKKWDAANMQNLSVKVRRDYAERIRTAAAAVGTTPATVMRQALDKLVEDYENGQGET